MPRFHILLSLNTIAMAKSIQYTIGSAVHYIIVRDQVQGLYAF